MHKKDGTSRKTVQNFKPGKKGFSTARINLKGAKNKSKLASLFEDHKEDLGIEYSLNDIFEIGYPFIETIIDVISSGKPSDISQDVHILLIELIDLGVNNKLSLAEFLGISESDFIFDELYTLLENGLLALSDDSTLRVTTKGELFIEQKKFIPVSTQEEFKFYFDGLTKDIAPALPSDISNSPNRLMSKYKVDFELIQENWFGINKCFSLANMGDREIVDLANYKRSIISKNERWAKYYVLVYYPIDTSGRKIQLKVYNNDSRILKRETDILNNLYSQNKYLFDFSNELAGAEEFKTLFLESSSEIKEEKLSGKYQDISTFEHKELIKEALMTAEVAVYIESPWIRKATMEYIPAIEFFLRKKNTKLFISYGIDGNVKNAPHPETFQQIEKLATNYPDRVFVFNLPLHFKSRFPKRNGSHRKILIKDFDFYVKGSYNWLSYSGNENYNYAVEEGTQFFDNVENFWKKVFSEYQLNEKLLTFLN